MPKAGMLGVSFSERKNAQPKSQILAQLEVFFYGAHCGRWFDPARWAHESGKVPATLREACR